MSGEMIRKGGRLSVLGSDARGGHDPRGVQGGEFIIPRGGRAMWRHYFGWHAMLHGYHRPACPSPTLESAWDMEIPEAITSTRMRANLIIPCPMICETEFQIYASEYSFTFTNESSCSI